MVLPLLGLGAVAIFAVISAVILSIFGGVWLLINGKLVAMVIALIFAAFLIMKMMRY